MFSNTAACDVAGLREGRGARLGADVDKVIDALKGWMARNA